MALAEKLAYVLTFDTSQGVASVQKFGATAEKEFGKAEGKLDKLAGNMTKFGVGAVAFAGVAGAGLVKLAGDASNLEESINAVNVTFGEAAGGVLKLGEEAARAVGLSTAEFNSLAVQFSSFATTVAGEGGNVVTTLDDLTTRAADFASVMNLDVAEAARVFQSGLAGETEPLKKFGIDLSAAAVGAFAVANGISDSASAMTEAEKVQARYGLLMEQTNKTQGDFANTSQGAANQQRILKAELENLRASIGSGVLPIMTSMLQVATKVTGAFSSLSPEVQGAIGKFAALGVGGLAVVGSLSAVAGQVIKMRDRFTDLDAATNTRSLNNFGKAAAGVGVAMGVAGVALAAYSIHQQRAAERNQDMIDGFNELSAVADAQVIETFGNALIKASLGGKGLDETLAELATTNIEGARRLLDVMESTQGVTSETAALRKAIIEQETAAANTSKTNEEYNQSLIDGTEATEDSVVAVKDATIATREYEATIAAHAVTSEISAESSSLRADAERDVADASTEATEAADRQKAALDALYSANIQLVGGDIAVRDAQRDAAIATLELADALEESGDNAFLQEVAIDDATKAQLAAAQAAVDYQVQQAAATGATIDQTTQAGLMASELRTLQAGMAVGSPLYNALQGYIDQLNSIPQNITSTISIEGKSVRINRNGDFEAFVSGRRARGGPVRAGGLYEVNENGSELLEENGRTYLMAGANGRVTPIASSPRAGTSGGSGGGPIDLSDDTIARLANAFVSGVNGNSAAQEATLRAGVRP